MKSFTGLCFMFLRGEESSIPPGEPLLFGCARSHVFGEPVLDPKKVRWGDDSPCSELVAECFKRGMQPEQVKELVECVQRYVRFAEDGGLVNYRKAA